MRHSTATTIHQAYKKALRDVWYDAEFKAAPRGQPIREILDYSFTILDPVAEPIHTLDMFRNVTIKEYTEKETELYDSGTNLAADFAKASKFWEKLANPDGTINSAYGHLIWKNKSCGNPTFEGGQWPGGSSNDFQLMRTPWEWCLESLKQDKDTRQAVLRFSLPEHQWLGNKDQVCTLNGNFLIRNDKLYFSVVMRSNDLMKGLVFDLPWFVSLMDKMVEELKPTYPTLTKGTYTHTSHSMHIYEKDEVAILKMLGD
jgi:thymidylate synthase